MDETLIKWLPYPEYKPLKGKPVLVTYNWKGLYFDKDDFEVGIGEYWNNGSGFGKWDKYVIAFTTLPQPYNVKKDMNAAYNQALEDALNAVEWDDYTLDIKERIEQLKK